MIVMMYPYLILLLLFPLIVRRLFLKRQNESSDAVRVPFLADLIEIEEENTAQNTFGLSQKFGRFPLALYLIWILLTLAAMRPVFYGEPIPLQTEGRDILLISDISPSMQELDFSYQGRRLDRLTAVKAVVSDFVKKRKNDRLGLILFSTRAYLQAPLTYDRTSLNEVLWAADAGMAGDSTAIGDALMLGLKTLQNAGGKVAEKVIILLTDGENNDGIRLSEAMAAVRQKDIKVYTIGVGQARQSLFNSFFGVPSAQLQNDELKQLAEETNGRYFQASDLNGLAEVYRAIDRLEPEQETNRVVRARRELFFYPLALALLLSVLWAIRMRRLL